MTALFPGSFDPFTIGHADIVERALKLFDAVVIAIGINREKPKTEEASEAHERLRLHYKDNKRVSVVEYSGLTTDICREMGISVILRGVRSLKDYEYERQMADINRRLTGVETLVMFADPTMESVSSSIVRELKSYGRDVSDLTI